MCFLLVLMLTIQQGLNYTSHKKQNMTLLSSACIIYRCAVYAHLYEGDWSVSKDHQ